MKEDVKRIDNLFGIKLGKEEAATEDTLKELSDGKGDEGSEQ